MQLIFLIVIFKEINNKLLRLIFKTISNLNEDTSFKNIQDI